jgi:hypothetical protein
LHCNIFVCRAGGEQEDEPNLEFIAPSKVYVVVGGVTTVLDIMQLPALTPRQMSLLAKQGPNGEYAGALLLLLPLGMASYTCCTCCMTYYVMTQHTVLFVNLHNPKASGARDPICGVCLQVTQQQMRQVSATAACRQRWWASQAATWLAAWGPAAAACRTSCITSSTAAGTSRGETSDEVLLLCLATDARHVWAACGTFVTNMRPLSLCRLPGTKVCC